MCFWGFLSFSPLTPPGSAAFHPLAVRRLQNQMVFRREGVALCHSLLSPLPQMVLITGAFKACFMSVGVHCPFSPLLCLVVGGGGGGGGGELAARLPACL